MGPKEVIRSNVEFGHTITRAYVGDLADRELLVRPVPGANHTAWQLGHLIVGTQHMLTGLGHQSPALPDGFAAAHSRETAASDDPAHFAAKVEYLRLADEMKAASLAAIAATPESQLDAPGPESMRQYAPTVGSALLLLGNHWLMHAGQFVSIRRKLGKPILF
jgi:hypothetical protein